MNKNKTIAKIDHPIISSPIFRLENAFIHLFNVLLLAKEIIIHQPKNELIEKNFKFNDYFSTTKKIIGILIHKSNDQKMNFTVTIMTIVLIITLFSPFGVYYGVKLAKNKNYKSHRKIQNIIFFVCVVGVLSLEGLITSAGGSGSLTSQSVYYKTDFFRYTLFSHIIVAVLSYLIWTFLIVVSNIYYQKKLPGRFSNFHKKTGYIIFGGLLYTAVTALMVYLMSLNLV